MPAVNTDRQTSVGLPQPLGSSLAGLDDRQLLDRFNARQDADAFEILVRRHGPMVLGVCRRMLRDLHAAEDAFQATFLVLVRRAAAIREPDLLGNWLYGVAVRIAIRARVQTTRRHDYETRTPFMSQNNVAHASVAQEIERRELLETLDEELKRLPRSCREPFVLCYLQDKTQAEAAQLLNCPVGSISGRLATAREKLRLRLSRRGLSFSASLLGAILIEQTSLAEVPRRLVDSSVSLAVQGINSHVAATTASPVVRRLADAVIRELQLGGVKRTVLAITCVLVASLFLYQSIMWTSAGRWPPISRWRSMPAGMCRLASLPSPASWHQVGHPVPHPAIRTR